MWSCRSICKAETARMYIYRPLACLSFCERHASMKPTNDTREEELSRLMFFPHGPSSYVVIRGRDYTESKLTCEHVPFETLASRRINRLQIRKHQTTSTRQFSAIRVCSQTHMSANTASPVGTFVQTRVPHPRCRSHCASRPHLICVYMWGCACDLPGTIQCQSCIEFSIRMHDKHFIAQFDERLQRWMKTCRNGSAGRFTVLFKYL